MQSHYRGVLDFSNEALVASEKGYNKLMEAFNNLKKFEYNQKDVDVELSDKIQSICESCYNNMNDDFNTPKVIANLFELVSIINTLLQINKLDSVDLKTYHFLLKIMNGFIEDVLGLELHVGDNAQLTEELINMVINLRAEAKINKDYTLSDNIRDQLTSLGITIKDGKDGTTYVVK